MWIISRTRKNPFENFRFLFYFHFTNDKLKLIRSCTYVCCIEVIALIFCSGFCKCFIFFVHKTSSLFLFFLFFISFYYWFVFLSVVGHKFFFRRQQRLRTKQNRTIAREMHECAQLKIESFKLNKSQKENETNERTNEGYCFL